MKLKNLIFLTLANHLPASGRVDANRWKLLKLAGINIKGPCQIWGPITMHNFNATHNLFIGKNVFINTEVRFACTTAKIIIRDNVEIGPRVSFETSGHGIIYRLNEGRSIIDKDIIVEENVWIGAGAILLPGVTVGKGAVVAAGAVVNKDVLPYTLVGGVPAKVIKTIDTNTIGKS